MTYLNQLIEVGHFTPHFSFLYLLIYALYMYSPMYLFLSIVSFIDYAVVGPQFKVFSSHYNMASPRPAFPHMNGMPSGHTELMWLLFVFFKMRHDSFHSFLFGCLAVFTSFQRIYTGMHSPLQVIIGFILGICMGYLWHKVYEYIEQQYQS